MRNTSEDLARKTAEKLRDIRKIIHQEGFSEFKIVSRPVSDLEDNENELIIPVFETNAVFISDQLFSTEIRKKWDQFILEHAMKMEELLIENLHHFQRLGH